MNVQQLLSELLTIEAQMGALKARKDELRGDLDTEARRRWAEDGAVPSFKVPRLGSATLSGCDSITTDVVDPGAYGTWARGSRPESVVLSVSVPAERLDDHAEALASLEGAEGISTAWAVHPAVLAGLVKAGRLDVDAGVLISEEGEVVPGVKVSPKEPYLTVRPDPEAKRRALANAAAQRERAMIAAESEVVLVAGVVDDLPDNPEFHDDNGGLVVGLMDEVASRTRQDPPDLAGELDRLRAGDPVAQAQEAVGATGGVTEAQRPPEPGSPEWYADLDDVFGPA